MCSSLKLGFFIVTNSVTTILFVVASYWVKKISSTLNLLLFPCDPGEIEDWSGFCHWKNIDWLFLKFEVVWGWVKLELWILFELCVIYCLIMIWNVFIKFGSNWGFELELNNIWILWIICILWDILIWTKIWILKVVWILWIMSVIRIIIIHNSYKSLE